MNHPAVTSSRLLAIALSSRGFGYAVLEGQNSLIECGAKSVKGKDKNRQCVAKVKKLLEFYRPDVLVLQDVAAKDSRRAPRIQALNKQMVEMAKKRKLSVAMFSMEQVRSLLLNNAKATKHELAEMLAVQFPAELESRLPPKRRPWQSEDSRMDIFAAMSLAVAFWVNEEQKMAGGGAAW
jgi:Holliday junction resolvasome RuvABC endonuclease subunit